MVWNFGSGAGVWMHWFMVICILIVGFYWIMAIYRAAMAKQKKRRNTNIKYAVMFGIGLASMIILFYFSFGSGKKVAVTPASKDGMRALVEEMPDEKAEEVIKEEAYEKKPEVLQRQDEGFALEEQEANDYLKKLLEREETG